VLPADVRAKLDTDAPRADADRYQRFLERRTLELGCRIAAPSQRQPAYLNINRAQSLR
jgi:hypothetical protein